jgi:hypothetical protein
MRNPRVPSSIEYEKAKTAGKKKEKSPGAFKG